MNNLYKCLDMSFWVAYELILFLIYNNLTLIFGLRLFLSNAQSNGCLGMQSQLDSKIQ